MEQQCAGQADLSPAGPGRLGEQAVNGGTCGGQCRQRADRGSWAHERLGGPHADRRTGLRRDRDLPGLRAAGGGGGRFLAIVRALMPAAAGAAEMPYRVFAIHNLLGGVVWGVGYSLLGYVAGSAYVVVERRVGAGLAIALAAAVIAAAAVWAWRRRRGSAVSPLGIDPPGEAEPDALATHPPLASPTATGTPHAPPQADPRM